ncbi:hypothetical protein RRG08_046424 [Elysia crispata]|uniref:Uncharacterized protein n=1 Tax=Elysia crispata TaxID=231223 RepID=A0AAE0Z8K8_9GAST|nr:hypothetical protein RRG08_046424 [Elysia crispata]
MADTDSSLNKKAFLICPYVRLMTASYVAIPTQTTSTPASLEISTQMETAISQHRQQGWEGRVPVAP